MLITLARHSATFSRKCGRSGSLPVFTCQFSGLSSPLPDALAPARAFDLTRTVAPA